MANKAEAPSRLNRVTVDSDSSIRHHGIVRIGMLARCDDRGLGIQTLEFYRHVKPEVTVVVVPSAELSRDFTQYPERYPDGVIAPWDGQDLPDAALERLAECDVIYTAETLYDARIGELAPKVVLHINPEFWRGEFGPTCADTYWLPTRWRQEFLPNRAVNVPVPIPVGTVSPGSARDPEKPLRVLHVHGHRTAGDRNGTEIVLEVIGQLQDHDGFEWRITFADRYWRRAIPARTSIMEYVTDRWTLYQEADVLLLPRRYGGLCLPAQEAAAMGLAVLMTACPPNDEYPALPIEHTGYEHINTPAGPVPVFAANPQRIVDELVSFQKMPDRLQYWKIRARQWAEERSWERMLPRYLQELERAASG